MIDVVVVVVVIQSGFCSKWGIGFGRCSVQACCSQLLFSVVLVDFLFAHLKR